MSSFKPNGSVLITIAVTGTAVSLASLASGGSQPAVRADVHAPSANVNTVYIGDGTVLNGLTNGGIALAPGDIYNLEMLADLNTVFVNGTAGDTVSLNWWQGS